MTPAVDLLLPAAEEIRDAIEPTGFKVLIYILQREAQMRNGLYQPDDTRALLETASPVAQVVALGALAYKDETRFPTGPWCQVGDFIAIRPYSGTRLKRNQIEYRLINDDTVEAVIRCDPREIERAV